MTVCGALFVCERRGVSVAATAMTRGSPTTPHPTAAAAAAAPPRVLHGHNRSVKNTALSVLPPRTPRTRLPLARTLAPQVQQLHSARSANRLAFAGIQLSPTQTDRQIVN